MLILCFIYYNISIFCVFASLGTFLIEFICFDLPFAFETRHNNNIRIEIWTHKCPKSYRDDRMIVKTHKKMHLTLWLLLKKRGKKERLGASLPIMHLSC